MSRPDRPPAWVVSEEALPLWGRLVSAAASTREAVPCAGHGAPFWHGDDEEQEAAARACLECPLMSLCDDYAAAADERWGVWGGRTERERRTEGFTR